MKINLHLFKKSVFRALLSFLIFFACFIYSYNGQAQVMGKTPKFLEGAKPNFFKMQRKAERYFKNYEDKTAPQNIPAEEDSSNEGQDLSFEPGYDREEDKDYHRYKRWEWYWRERINPDGSFPDAMESFETYTELQSTGNNRMAAGNPTWSDISMKTNSGGYWGLGRTESVAINPKNSLEFYVTGDGGGVWKTIDGGKTYKAVGDQLPMLFCGKVLVDHQTPSTVYVSLGDDHNQGGTTGLGVYKSTDGGNTWNPTGLTAARNNTISIRFMAMSPTNSKLIIAVTNRGVFRTADAGVTWTTVRTGSHFDVVFKPGDGNTVFVSSLNNGGKSEIYRSTDAGLTYTQVSTFNNATARIRMSTSLSNPNFLGVALMGGNTYYTSTDGGTTYTLRSTMPSGCELLVSQVNTNNVYCGCVDNYRSTDGGVNWTQFTHWSGATGLKEVHADNHGINFDPSKPNEIYVSNDGGVEKFNETTNTWTYLSNGLGITMYYQIGVAQTHAMVIAGGTQDNGGNWRRRDGTWRNTTGGDATSCLVDPSNDNIMYSQYINGDGIVRTTNGWTNRTNLDSRILAAGVASGDGDWATPFAIHEADPRILVGGYRDVIITFDRGDNWKKISNGLTSSNLRKIAISATNPNYIYTSTGSNFFRTFDQGATAWTAITHPGGSVNKIVVHPTDPKTVYTTNNGGNGKRVYKSIDGGTTWTNLSTGIPNDISVVGLAYEKGSNEGLYIGTTVGVFYKNTNMDWIYYGIGLPNTSITDLQISYFAKKIRVGTFGRGIWEADLYAPEVTDVADGVDIENRINVYPNPFVESFTVESSLKIASLKLRDASGQEVSQLTMDNNGSINLKDVSKGIYFLEITLEDSRKVTKKIVKQ